MYLITLGTRNETGRKPSIYVAYTKLIILELMPKSLVSFIAKVVSKYVHKLRQSSAVPKPNKDLLTETISRYPRLLDAALTP